MVEVATHSPHAQGLMKSIIAQKADIDELSRGLNESTRWSWLWAFLFGPIYFGVHGFWGRAFIVFALNFVLIGLLVGPFIVYPAWRKRAEDKAEKMLLIDSVRRRN